MANLPAAFIFPDKGVIDGDIKTSRNGDQAHQTGHPSPEAPNLEFAK